MGPLMVVWTDPPMIKAMITIMLRHPMITSPLVVVRMDPPVVMVIVITILHTPLVLRPSMLEVMYPSTSKIEVHAKMEMLDTMETTVKVVQREEITTVPRSPISPIVSTRIHDRISVKVTNRHHEAVSVVSSPKIAV